MSERKKIGLALGSGAARGWAHIGVIEALEEKGIQVDYIAGTSMGALVGSIYAAGKLQILKEFVLTLSWKQLMNFFDPVFPRSGLIDGKRIADFINEHSENAIIEDMNIPFAAVCTDLLTGCEHVIKEGKIIDAVRGSISIPGMFTPLRLGERLLVDGALVNPVPVSVVKDMGAEFVIAVDVNYGTNAIKASHQHKVTSQQVVKQAIRKVINLEEDATEAEEAEDTIEEKWQLGLHELGKRYAIFQYTVRNQIEGWMDREKIPGILEILLASYNILEVQVTETMIQADPPDVLIRPDLSDMAMVDFDRAEEAIERGYKKAIEEIDKNPAGL